MTTLPPSERTRVRRLPLRAAYDRDTIHAILDTGFVCHVGLVDDGQPVVIPTAYARDGETIILHGSSKSRMMEALGAGAPVCITVTHVDGFVLARSAFHHSINYRSVVIFGCAEPVVGEAARLAALERFFDRIHPGRWAAVRPPNAQELKATAVVRVPITEASAKTRAGGPLDDAEDMSLDVWAGVVPLTLERGTPVRDGTDG